MTTGRTIAMAVCGLLLAASPRLGHTDDKTKEAKVKCQGINECKGKGSCATAANACAGQNGCKGKGWIAVTAKTCKAKKGTILVEKKPAPAPAPTK